MTSFNKEHLEAQLATLGTELNALEAEYARIQEDNNQWSLDTYGKTWAEVQVDMRNDERKAEAKDRQLQRDRLEAELRADDDHIGLWLNGFEE